MKTLWSSLLLACATFTHADTMSLNVNPNQKEFIITLPANPTTGYQWTVEKYDKSFLKLLSSNYLAAKTKLIGAGGQMQFTFQLLKGKSYPQSTTMQFKYARPWEQEKGTLKQVTVNFSTDKPSSSQ
ncbi:protease inhibitor I42 family protein [Legionella clemsonensis]|uniref:Chagasin family peptidase inhibitor I42 n=1 Tax=Legionella clemsonensis TaxID=1867846 RepID=A0A222P1E6_9GAMM|nr:protease inhibitor I42 family protein [Legionella clemsonensis]ASQ45641.1 Chagasin family peptidase inhibitor I42 [Legionella clemsonensis]